MAENNPMELFNCLLSNPEALRAVGKMLSSGAVGTPAAMPSMRQSDSVPSGSAGVSSGTPDLSRIMSSEDNGTRLLHALEPYLSEKRRSSVGQIVQAVKMGKVISAMSKGNL